MTESKITQNMKDHEVCDPFLRGKLIIKHPVWMLESLNKNFKAVITVNEDKGNTLIINEKVRNLRREIKNIKTNQLEILEPKSTIFEILKSWMGLTIEWRGQREE